MIAHICYLAKPNTHSALKCLGEVAVNNHYIHIIDIMQVSIILILSNYFDKMSII